MPDLLLGVDTGGTFTDFVLCDGDRLQFHKVLSTPDAPERAILQGIEAMGLMPAVRGGNVRVIHGSTVATNAALEGRGVRAAFVTTAGFADVLTLGRQARPALYDLQPALTVPPVPVHDCHTLPGRIDALGRIIEPLDETALAALANRLRDDPPGAIAVCLLFSHMNPAHEYRVREALAGIAPLSLSCEIRAGDGEYERGIATWLNATLGPRVEGYLQRLQQALSPSPLSVMQSTGDTIDAMKASARAVHLLLSGPAGGLAAARMLAGHHGIPHLLTFDMGGTSTDVAMIAGEITLTDSGRIGPWPVAVPMVDLHTIGAGGGSIASLDEGGMLRVGPQSAGADPGPACYGRGGVNPTVTDANAILGRLRPEFALGGQLTVDVEAARHAMAPLAAQIGLSIEATAAGVLTVANEHMAHALRVMSLQRGHSLQGCPLLCFGGAGGLHVCELADAVGIDEILMPAHGGVFSALGMLVAPRGRREQHAVHALTDTLTAAALKTRADQLIARGVEALAQEGVNPDDIHHHITWAMRYRGQHHCLDIEASDSLRAAVEAFHAAHQARYGHRLRAGVEVARIEVRLQAPPAVHLPTLSTDGAHDASPLSTVTVPMTDKAVTLWERNALQTGQAIDGPAIIGERISTAWVGEGWSAMRLEDGTLKLTRRVRSPR